MFRWAIALRGFGRNCSCGLAAAFLAMNAVHGEIFVVRGEEALTNGYELQDRSIRACRAVRCAASRAPIPERFGVHNVYSELGSVFGPLVVTDPEFAALLVGILIEGLGPRNVLWGTDAVLLGRPQWVIESFRRLKIFDIFERYFGVTPTARYGNLSETTVKHWILGANAASLFGIDARESFAQTSGDRLSRLKPDTASRNHLNGALGYVAP